MNRGEPFHPKHSTGRLNNPTQILCFPTYFSTIFKVFQPLTRVARGILTESVLHSMDGAKIVKGPLNA